MNHVKQQKNNNLKTKQWRKKRHRRQQWLWHIYIKSLWICDHMTSLFKTWNIQTQKTGDSIPNYCDVCWPWWKDDMLYQLQKWFLSLGSFLFLHGFTSQIWFSKTAVASRLIDQPLWIALWWSLSDGRIPSEPQVLFPRRPAVVLRQCCTQRLRNINTCTQPLNMTVLET